MVSRKISSGQQVAKPKVTAAGRSPPPSNLKQDRDQTPDPQGIALDPEKNIILKAPQRELNYGCP